MDEYLTENFNIADVITEGLIDLDLQAESKEEAILELTNILYKEGLITDVTDFSEDVFLREKEGATGLGQGVAIPHGKSDSVIKTALAIGKTTHPIEWESLDDKPVNIIILFAVRNTEANTLHIKLLQKVAILLADDSFIHALCHVKTKKELLRLLSKEPG
ncbi:PTS sugar transporter subunit IIA [Tetragenococcus koreensis]|uniref:PTS sugar transporter subunit IIA n=1 Tax=Tetragenococcus koreensis TaxID=290335 RepID=UPI001F17C8A4|nr:PTS sugar transporter subunit IIA [Tetragenococcus koreensis]MCF1627713.1 fructose PTS transporter subunit IIA [Tetragenococcus koreensis]MDN6391749.1 fructose PTS transporter subunit IIA [Lactococcus lactis]MDN6640677.1 fructose PTS transporter subunit IIA [Tetragenococcus sp.]